MISGEKLFRNGLLAAAATAGALALGGCADKLNTSGKGNEFELTGELLGKPGDHSINIRVIEVEHANGKAKTWFDKGGHRIHDNYQTCGGTGDDEFRTHVVGKEVDAQGGPIDLKDLKKHDWVRVEGKIRKSRDDCPNDSDSQQRRPVFDHLIKLKHTRPSN